MTPFEALYGRPYVVGRSTVISLDELLKKKHMILSRLKNNLQITIQQMVAQANKNRREIQFQGDLVLLKLQPYRQSSVQLHAS